MPSLTSDIKKKTVSVLAIVRLLVTVKNITWQNETQHNAIRTHRLSDTTAFRRNAIPTLRHSDTTAFRHIAWNTYGCAQAPAVRLTGPLDLQGLLLLYPARALIVRPYANSSKLWFKKIMTLCLFPIVGLCRNVVVSEWCYVGLRCCKWQNVWWRTDGRPLWRIKYT